MRKHVSKIEVELFEADPNRPTVVSQTGIHRIAGVDIEEAIHINESHFELRVLGEQPRTFKINLRQLLDRALEEVCRELDKSKPGEAGPL